MIARVGIVMGSRSDHATMAGASEILSELGVRHVWTVVSAHRTPLRMVSWAQGAREQGIRVVIAGAGGAAHLPGMVAALTPLPVIGVPVPAGTLGGLDSLLSIAQMPTGVPVATVAIGGARNAGLLAVRILALEDAALAARHDDWRSARSAAAEADGLAMEQEGLRGGTLA